jgi:hypothetical protein
MGMNSFDDDYRTNHTLGLMHHAGVLIFARNGEDVGKGLTGTEKAGVEWLGSTRIRDFFGFNGQRWIAGRVMYLVADVFPLNALSHLYRREARLKRRRHVEHLNHDVSLRCRSQLRQKSYGTNPTDDQND